MEDRFDKITNKAFAVIFTVLFITTLVGIFAKGAYWHIPTLIVTGILAVAFWFDKEDEQKDNSSI